MRFVQFAFIREGSTDDGIGDHLETLLIEAGADEAIQQARDYSGTTFEKLQAVLAEGIPFDAIFVHRDTDRDGHVQREAEIFDAAKSLRDCPPVIPVTPSRMTEAWLLLDEGAIRAVAGRPSGTSALNLPGLQQVESIADPKSVLKEALATASELRGRDLSHFAAASSFARQRGVLMQRLDLEGRVRELQALRRLCEDIAAFIERAPRSTPRRA